MTTAAANPTRVPPTPKAHFSPGYLLYCPVEIILSTATMVPAIASTAINPEAIAIAPSPAVAVIIVPRVKAANPKATIVRPTPIAHFKLGYLSYFPKLSISDESDITVAIATITNPPFIISVKYTLDRYFIERAITTAVPTSANDNKVNLIILPIETSGILLIIHPAIATVVVQPINIKPAFSTSLGFKFFSLSTISFNVNE